MHISVKVEFKNKNNDINALVYNLKSEFCDFYSSPTLEQRISVDETEQKVLKQLEHTDAAQFISSKDNIPFKITIDWKKNLIDINPINGRGDILFYTDRALETCNNFAIYEFIADSQLS